MNPEYLSPLGNHLWQSTLFAGIAGLLTLALGNNRARARLGMARGLMEVSDPPPEDRDLMPLTDQPPHDVSSDKAGSA